MGKGRRDNARARRKRGQKAFRKRTQRKKNRRQYVGPWKVTFSCGKTECFPLASSREINDVANRLHQCSRKACKAKKFQRLG